MGRRHSKVGLALSGGGLRAAFYHVGVLAHLADIGMLRRIEVISTVSGGSIVGALYYLHLKRLLESKPDAAISDTDYCTLVERVERELFAAVERNFRVSAFVNIGANWRMLRSDYSRTDRLGELYDLWLYRPAAFGSADAKRPVCMRDLKIRPFGAQADFHPRRDNGSRSAKVPILLINATSLNSGRNWRFEASRMGESPSALIRSATTDLRPRYAQPISYDVLPEHLAHIPLGKAVAASTAVPGLFRPLPISALYPKRILQLVDGAVHDNQGVQGLLDERCDLLLVSDASAQLSEDPKPDPNFLPVLLRTEAILLHRVREEQMNLCASTPLAFIHMRQGLTPPTITYMTAQGVEASPPAPPETRVHPQRPNIDPEVQERLTQVRTDLDSFTEVEAYSLMAFGYKVSEAVVPNVVGLRALRSAASNWRFWAVEPWLRRPTPDYLRQLTVASGQLLKVFRLVPWTLWLTCLVLFGLVTYGLHAVGGWERLFAPQMTQLSWSWGALLLTAGVLLIAYRMRLRWLRTLLVLPLPWARRPFIWLARVVVESILPVLAALFIYLYLATFDRLFVAAGRIDRLKPAGPLRRARTSRSMARHP